MFPAVLTLFLATAVVATPPTCASLPAIEPEDVRIRVSDGRGHVCGVGDPCLALDTIGVFAETSTPGALLNCPFQIIVGWRFSDGMVQQSPMAIRTFTKPGAYDAVLTINPNGIVRTVRLVIVERPASPLHVRTMSGDRWNALQFALTHDSAAPDVPRFWSIDYGDGVIDSDYATLGLVLRHQYAKAGSYIVTAYSQTIGSPSIFDTYKFAVTIVEPVRRRIAGH
jgi:hypothetical protein